MIHVIRRHGPSGVLGLVLSEVALISAGFYAAAYLLLQPDPNSYFLYEGGLGHFFIMLATLLLAIYFFDLYTDLEVHSRTLLFQQLCQAIGVALIAQSVLAYVLQGWILPQWVMLSGCVIVLVLLFCWRLLYSAAILRVVGRERILFVGRNSTVEAIAREIAADPGCGIDIAGYVEDEPLGPLAGAPQIGPLSSLNDAVVEEQPARIVVGLSERRARMPVTDLLSLRFGGAQIEEASRTYEMIYRRVCTSELNLRRAIFSRELNRPFHNAWLSEVLQQTIALLLAIAFSPVLLAIFCALKLSSKDPAIVRLTRLGKDAVVFTMYRFRLVRGLRRFHLDALPELFNVVAGDMLLVGPSPLDPARSHLLAREMPLFEYRYNVRPGMTGWAQINLPRNEEAQDRIALEYDLYYIKHMSHALNLLIVMNTLKNRVLRA